MARTSYILMRWWWCPLCSRQTHLSWIFVVLAHWSNSPWVDMSLHSDTICWFRANYTCSLHWYSLLVAQIQKCTIPYWIMGKTLYMNVLHWYNFIEENCRLKLKYMYNLLTRLKEVKIKFVSDLWQVSGFLRVLRFPPPIKLTATI